MIETVVIRPPLPNDADGLGALYDGLSTADRRLRFFSQYRPTRSDLEAWAGSDEQQFNLVAVALPGRRVVGHALAVALPDGDAEFALVVDAAWRGGLGGDLFGALLDAADARGVPNLCGEILEDNRPMRRLVSRRGYVTLDRPEPGVVRVAVGASQPTPVWPGEGTDGTPKVLVEAPGGLWRAESALRAAGVRVATCPGATRPEWCPVAAGRSCPLVADCQAVVVVLRDPDDRGAALVEAHARMHPSIPLCVQSPAINEPAAFSPGVVPLPVSMSVDDVVCTVMGLIPDRPATAWFVAAPAEDVAGGVEQGRLGRPWPCLLAGVQAE